MIINKYKKLIFSTNTLFPKKLVFRCLSYDIDKIFNDYDYEYSLGDSDSDSDSDINVGGYHDTQTEKDYFSLYDCAYDYNPILFKEKRFRSEESNFFSTMRKKLFNPEIYDNYTKDQKKGTIKNIIEESFNLKDVQYEPLHNCIDELRRKLITPEEAQKKMNSILFQSTRTEKGFTRINKYLVPEIKRFDEYFEANSGKKTGITSSEIQKILMLTANSNSKIELSIGTIVFKNIIDLFGSSPNVKYADIKALEYKKISKTNFVLQIGKNTYQDIIETYYQQLNQEQRKTFLTPPKLSSNEYASFGDFLLECITSPYPDFFRKSYSHKKSTLVYYQLSTWFCEKVHSTSLSYLELPSLIRIPNYKTLNDNFYINNRLIKPLTYKHMDYLKKENFKDSLKVGDSILKALNTLKNTEFWISEVVLNHMLVNIADYYLKFVDGNDWGLRFGSSKDLIDYLEKKENRKLTFREKKVHTNMFNRLKAMTDYFIETIVIAQIFVKANCPIYFSTKIDWRCRVYYDGWPLMPQGDIISKLLLSPWKNNVKEEDLISVLEFKTLKDFYKYICKKSAFAPFDVTASGFQILALLSGCIITLGKTKFIDLLPEDIEEVVSEIQKEFPEVSIKSELELDFYNTHKKRFIEALTIFIRNPSPYEKPKKFNKGMSKEDIAKLLDLREKAHNTFWKETMPMLLKNQELLDEIFDRIFIKDLIMCRAYSESSFSRGKKFVLNFDEKSEIEIDLQIGLILAKIFDEVLLKYNKRILEVEEFIFQKLPSLINQKLFLICSHPISSITKGDYFSGPIIYPEQESKRIWIKRNKLSTRYTVKIDKIPYEPKAKDIKRSILPNFVQHLDARILISLVNKCQEEGIVLSVNHDAFIVSVENSKRLNELYRVCCEEIFYFFGHPIANFLKNNNQIDDENTKKLIKKWRSSLEDILSQRIKTDAKILT